MSGSARLRPVVRGGLALVLVLVALVLTGSPAQATSGLEVGIRLTSGNTLPSGTPFDYEVALVCTRSHDGCADVVARIPLGDAAAYQRGEEPGTAPAGLTVTQAVEDDELVVRLSGSLPAGGTALARFSLTPPNDTTPDGTSWELEPTATSSNAGTSRHAPPGYDEEVTAHVDATTTAVAHVGLRDSSLRRPGDEVTFDLRISCVQPDTGNWFPGRLEIRAELARGLTLVRATPAGAQVTGRTLTWTPEGGALPASCRERGADGVVTGTVTARIDQGQTDRAQLPLSLRVTPTTAGGGHRWTGEPATDSAQVTVMGAPGASPGSLFAGAFGQVRTSTSDDGTAEDRSQATYPGNWLGVLPAQPAFSLEQFQPNGATGLAQAGFKTSYNNIEDGSGYAVGVAQQMPCLGSGTRHEPSSGSCAPAFHATTAALWVDNDADGATGEAVPGSYRARALLTDGRRVTLHRTGGTTALDDRGQWVGFSVPDSAVGRVRAIEFPASTGIESYTMSWAVFGYVDPEVDPGEVVVARSAASATYGDDTTQLSSRDAVLTVVARPQLGVDASYAAATLPEVGATTTLDVTGSALLPAGSSTDLVLAERLPEGLDWHGSVPATLPATLEVTHRATGRGQTVTERDVELPLVVARNAGGSGRTLVRAVLDADDLAAQVTDEAGARVRLQLSLPVVAERPGLLAHEARLVAPGTPISQVCAQRPATTSRSVPTSATGLAHTAPGCLATSTVQVETGDGAASFSVDVQVQGDADEEPKAAPSLGLADDGEATYTLRWRNTSTTPLKDVTLVDVLPTLDDTLLAGAASGTPRGSGFEVELLDVEAPTGVRVATADDSDVCHSLGTAPPAEGCAAWQDRGDLDGARALRLTSGATYDIGEGFDVTLTVGLPDDVAVGSVAWNTAAATARNAWSGSTLPPVESAKVGLTPYAATLPPVVTVETDRAYAGPGEPVTYTVRLANPGPHPITTAAPVGTLPVGLDVVGATAGAVVRLLLDVVDGLTGGLLGLPSLPEQPGFDPTQPRSAGSEVTWPQVELAPYETRDLQLTAQPDAYSAGSLLSRFVVEGAILPNPCPEGAGVCAEVNVPSGQLTVTHEAEGDGAPLYAAGPTAVRVDCVRGGVPVHGFPRTLLLTDGQVSAALPVPYGAVCSGGVTQDQGATDVAVSPATGTTVTPEAPQGALVVTTRFDLARVVVDRRVSGVGAAMAPARALVSVTCRWRDQTLPGFPMQLPMARGERVGLTAQLPVGALCTSTEESGAPADEVPGGSVVATAVADGESLLSTHGVYSAGRVRVTAADDLDDDARVAVTCRREGAVVWSGEVRVAPGATAVARSGGRDVLLPAGTGCEAAPTDRAQRVRAGGALAVAADGGARVQDLDLVVGAAPAGQAAVGGLLDAVGLGGARGPGGVVGLPGNLADPSVTVPGAAPTGPVPPAGDPTTRTTTDDDPDGELGLAAPASSEADDAGDGGRDVPVLPLTLGGLLLLAAGALWTRFRLR
ncbi:putative repeat protein (TIGR01451 family) [Nocardioides zeae]|uniref:Repeat protein (TIGR01451 family) n=1 Tax=Nocardioides zeae TaxID=1457234 RepID=A0ACC6INQ4_9ACTN|nr:DUF5979 domain-containing protein [Nocardioides zeae]MDR6174395.1 putative repeat protein (TIGR01451 family) [Nocardioides zeae]MDR6212292.1 putative repeat protein (TIGR01451 family) [Nocardioides zeae]